MKIGYNWLKSYVNIDCDLATLCEKLTMAGIEVEGIEQAAGVPDGVVVAKIMERKPHPDSDHMSVCQVFDGSETIQVHCACRVNVAVFACFALLLCALGKCTHD